MRRTFGGVVEESAEPSGEPKEEKVTIMEEVSEFMNYSHFSESGLSNEK